jgi:hypothetical protein
MTLVEFLVLTLAVFRLARLVIEDTITEPLRTWILGRWPGEDVKYEDTDYVKGGTVRVGTDLYAAEPTKAGNRIAKLLGCPWCVSPYLAAVVVGAFYLWPVPTFWLALVAAISAVVGLLSSAE